VTKSNACPRGVGKHVFLIMLLLFLFFSAAYAVWLTRCEMGRGQQAGASAAAKKVDEAGRALVTYNRAVSVGLLIGGSLFIIYCVKTISKTGGRCKRGIRRQMRRA
jgi:hypothetical protein